MKRSVVLAAGLLLTLAALPACRRRMPPRPAPPLVPSGQLGRPFVLRQQVTAEAEDEKRSMQVVVQLADGELVLVGLGPHGARVMQATQRGEQVDQRVLVPIRLPFTALDVLGDVHRVLFRGCQPPAETEDDGSHEVDCMDRGARVHEVYQDGQLRERSYADAASGKVHTRIHYQGDGMILAKRVRIDNLQYGYSLTIQTLSQQWLD